MLISHSVFELQQLYNSCETELLYQDMVINAKKSCCIRIGPRHKFECASIITKTGHPIPWVEKNKYLGVTFTSSYSFKCSFDDLKKKYFRSVNAIFSIVGRSASEEVVLHLVYSKCIPILLYASEVCPITKSDLKSLDFSVNRFLFKLFKTNNIETVKECRSFFNFQTPSEIIPKRVKKFDDKINIMSNMLLTTSF